MNKIISDSHFNSYWNAIVSGEPKRQETAIKLFGIDAVNGLGETLLIKAAKKAHLAATRYLLGKGANPNIRARNGATALYEASRRETDIDDIVSVLIDKGADPNAPGKREMTPLIVTAQTARLHSKLVLLIRKGAKVNQRDTVRGMSPLFQAAQLGNDKAIRTLLVKGATVNATTHKGETPLWTAVDDRHLSSAKILLEFGKADPNIQADLGDGPVSPLDLLISTNKGRKDLEFIELLLKKGADPYQIDLNSSSSVGYAVSHGRLDVLKVFAKHKVDFDKPADKKGTTPLMIAIQYKDKEIRNFLLNKGVNVNVKDQDGTTALHYACNFKDEKSFNAIIDRVDDIDAPGKLGVTQISLASETKAVGIVKKLIYRGANLEIPDELGGRALHKAAVYCPEALRLLVLNGADVNARMNDGATPLLMAAQDGKDENVEFLLKNGADPELKRNDTNSPLFMAHKYGHKKTVELILRALSSDAEDIQEFKFLGDIKLPGKNLTLVFFHPVYKPKAPAQLKSEREPSVEAIPYEPPPQEEEGSNSSTSYLLKQGFSIDQIKEMRNQSKKQKVETTIKFVPVNPKEVSWFDGKLTGDHKCVRLVEGKRRSTNCFVYIDTKLIKKAGCVKDEIFTKMDMKFAPRSGGQGLVKLPSFKHFFELRLNGKKYPVRTTDEIKTLSSEGRILCCRVLSDDGRETLMIGYHYLPQGLHKKHVIHTLPKVVTLSPSA